MSVLGNLKGGRERSQGLVTEVLPWPKGQRWFQKDVTFEEEVRQGWTNGLLEVREGEDISERADHSG